MLFGRSNLLLSADNFCSNSPRTFKQELPHDVHKDVAISAPRKPFFLDPCIPHDSQSFCLQQMSAGNSPNEQDCVAMRWDALQPRVVSYEEQVAAIRGQLAELLET